MADTYPIAKLNLNDETIEFSGQDVIEATLLQEVRSLSIELPVSTATLRVRTTDPRFTPFADGSFYQELSANAIIDIWESIDDASYLLGRFYLKEWDNPVEGEIEFRCEDAIGLLDKIPFDGMFWKDEIVAWDAIRAVLDPTGLSYGLPDLALTRRKVKGYLPSGTVREALQQLLFASMGYVSTAHSTRLEFKDTKLALAGINDPAGEYGDFYYGGAFYGDVAYDGSLPDNSMTGKRKLELAPMVTAVQLISHDFTEGTTQEEIYRAYLEPGDYKIVYDKPYYGVTAEGVGATPAYLMTEDLAKAITTEDGRIISFAGEFEFGVNYVYLHVTVAGDIVVRGYPYIDSTRSFNYTNPAGANAAQNVLIVDKALLVHSGIAEQLLSALVSYSELRYKQDVTLFPDPAMLPGAVVRASSLYGKTINATIMQIRSLLTGGFLLETKLIGVERKL